MLLTHLNTSTGSRWALEDNLLHPSFSLTSLLTLPADQIPTVLASFRTAEKQSGGVLAPIETQQEVWASGVTYLRSREARKAESSTADIYQRVYEAQRPELFFKASGWRVLGTGQSIRIRKDSHWNVPEPELTLVINRLGEIVGYCAGDDVSSRDIEGENPLYLPQAKDYNGSCALGPGIHLISSEQLVDIPIKLEISRNSQVVFNGETSTSNMKRSFEELVQYLYMELDFPFGAFLMTGTGIVPSNDFSLQPGDSVSVCVGSLKLVNLVSS